MRVKLTSQVVTLLTSKKALTKDAPFSCKDAEGVKELRFGEVFAWEEDARRSQDKLKP
jgi:hypothetical protein